MADDGLREVSELFQRIIGEIQGRAEQEVQAVGEVQDGFSRRAAQLDALSEGLQGKLAELERRIEAARADGAQPRAAAEHSADVMALTAAEDATMAAISESRKALQEAKVAVQKLQQEGEDVKQRRRALEEAVTSEMPKTKMKIEAYTMISRISWDEESQASCIKGVFKGSRASGPRPFEFDTTAEEQWRIADSLWDAI